MNEELAMIADDILTDNVAIEHHGIKGQHWGDRNGPPYPLDRSDLSPVEKRNYPEGSNAQQKVSLGKKLTTAVKEHHQEKVDQAKKAAAQKKRAATIAKKKKEAEEAATKEENRKKQLYSYSPEELLEHHLEYSDDEINDAINKIKTENSLQKVAIDTAKNEQDLHDQKIKAAKRANDYLNVAVDYGQTAIKIYNVIATLSGEPTLEKRAEVSLEKIRKQANIDLEKANRVETKSKDSEPKKTRAEKKEEKYEKKQDEATKDFDKQVRKAGNDTEQVKMIMGQAAEKLDSEHMTTLYTTYANRKAASDSAKKSFTKAVRPETKSVIKDPTNNNNAEAVSKSEMVSKIVDAYTSVKLSEHTQRNEKRAEYNSLISQALDNPDLGMDVVQQASSQINNLSALFKVDKEENKGKGGNS